MRIQWNIKKANSADECHAIAGYFCPHCGSEIFSEWFYSRKCEWEIASPSENATY